MGYLLHNPEFFHNGTACCTMYNYRWMESYESKDKADLWSAKQQKKLHSCRLVLYKWEKARWEDAQKRKVAVSFTYFVYYIITFGLYD